MAIRANGVEAQVIRTVEPLGTIDWHVEQRGSGHDVILVPSGEGDCASFDLVARELAFDYRVTTFDTPGFSRSSISGHVEISMVALAPQVASLIRKLGIEQATFYGCSSAGLAVLDLAANYEDLVHCAVIHEAALPPADGDISPLIKLADLDDLGITAACADLFETFMNEDPVAWRALGDEYHRRLALNYPTWVHQYVAGVKHAPIDPSSLHKKPIIWTIGGLMEARMFFSNVKLAHRADIALGLLPCKHFPQVSIPILLADHIRSAVTQFRAAYGTAVPVYSRP